MNRGKNILYAAILLISGAILGAVSLHAFMRFNMAHHFEDRRHNMAQVVMRHLDRELSLTDDQQERLLPIVEEMHNKLSDIRRENRPRMEAVIDEAQTRAEAVLTPDQQVKLREMRARMKARFDREP